MDNVSYLLAGLILFGFTVHGLLNRYDKSVRKFPWCKEPGCGLTMVKAPIPKVLPDQVRWYLMAHDLPATVVTRYKCPRGHYQLWYIPKFGNTERAFFLREEL
jgi:hypothetical protein